MKSLVGEEVAVEKGIFIKTPLIDSTPLSNLADAPVYLKLENAQPSGSFKLRGISFTCQQAALRGCRELVCASGGNAGLATAYSARELAMKCIIFVPKNVSEAVRDKMKVLGAEVEVAGEVFNETNERAAAYVREDPTRYYVHPYDDPFVWTGHSSMVDEIVDDFGERNLPPPSIIVTCCGGGGLICGIVEGLRRHGWERVAVVAMETKGAHSLNACVRAAGVPVNIGRITSIAVTLGSVVVCEKVAEAVRERRPEIVSAVVSDAAAVDACLRFADHHRLLVEPSCGAALAAVYGGRVRRMVKEHGDVGPVVVIVCGGAGVDLDVLRKWKEEFGL